MDRPRTGVTRGLNCTPVGACYSELVKNLKVPLDLSLKWGIDTNLCGENAEGLQAI
jgi:hypothetical protein